MNSSFSAHQAPMPMRVFATPGLQGLALFRICFGVLLLVDFLFNLSPYFQHFFSEQGLYPTALNRLLQWHPELLSVLPWLQQPWQFALFEAVYTTALLCFVLGYRTGIAKIIVLIGASSLYYRNPIITSGADMLMRVFLVWCLFVPMSRYWSVDSALNRAPRGQTFPAIFAAGIKLQICMLYIFGAIFKLFGQVWWDGQGPSWAVHDGAHGTLLGASFSDATSFLTPVLNWGIIFFQLGFSGLVYSPWKNNLTRGIAMLGAFVMHFSFIFFLQVGIFPYICISYLALLVPDTWFDAALAKRRARLENLVIYFDPDCRFCEKTARLLRELCLSPFTRVLPASADAEALALLIQHHSWVVRDHASGAVYMKWRAVSHVLKQNPFTWIFGALTDMPFTRQPMASVYEWIGRHRGGLGKITAALFPFAPVSAPSPMPLRKAVCAALIVLAFACNIVVLPAFDQNNPLVKAVIRASYLSQIFQRWDLFAPRPTHNLYDYRVTGTTQAGRRVDLAAAFEDGHMARLGGGYLEFPNHHWLKYYTKLFDSDKWTVLRFNMQWQCARYNAAHAGDKMKQIDVTLYRQHYAKVRDGMPRAVAISGSMPCDDDGKKNPATHDELPE